MFAKFFILLQIFEDAREEFCIFAAEFAHGFAAARGFAVFFLRCVETCFINIEALFTGDVTGDFEGQAVGGVEVEGVVTVEGGLDFDAREVRRVDSPNEQYQLQPSARSGFPLESDYPKSSPCSFPVRDKNPPYVAITASATLARNGSLSPILVPKRAARRMIMRVT